MKNKNSHGSQKLRRRLLGAAFVLSACVCLGAAAPRSAEAAAKTVTPAYRATTSNRSTDFLQGDPGSTLTVSLDATNTGKNVWRATGTNLVALNAVKQTTAGLDVNRATVLRDPSWATIVRPVGLVKNVKPGETARLTFTLRVPKKTGEYREWFSLAIKGVDFMPGGAFEILVRSDNPTAAAYRADTGLASAVTFTMDAGRAKTFEITVKNTGSETWKRRGAGEVVLALAEPQQRESLLWHPNWYGKTILGRLTAAEVKPGKQGTFRFAVQAPKAYGEYTEKVQILVPGLTRAVDGLITLTVVVPNPTPVVVNTNSLGAEPTVRVGMVVLADGTASFTSTEAFVVRDEKGVTVVEIAANGTVKVAYANGSYTVTPTGAAAIPGVKGSVRLMSKVAGTVMKVSSWQPPYNQFRGTLEVRFTPTTGRTWVINELPLEQYVSGLAETGNTGPTEFLKTMAVAARTYALFHNLRKTKHADENYDINATTDQVYLGYGYELKVPNLVAAAVATRGVVATHPAATSAKNVVSAIVTAYSSCTDGRTHSSKEVWNLDLVYFPYLAGVPDPLGTCTTPPYPSTYITGGGGNHMVGMSAFGALKYAQDQGKTFDWILTYYYTGVTLKQVYL